MGDVLAAGAFSEAPFEMKPVFSPPPTAIDEFHEIEPCSTRHTRSEADKGLAEGT